MADNSRPMSEEVRALIPDDVCKRIDDHSRRSLTRSDASTTSSDIHEFIEERKADFEHVMKHTAYQRKHALPHVVKNGSQEVVRRFKRALDEEDKNVRNQLEDSKGQHTAIAEDLKNNREVRATLYAKLEGLPRNVHEQREDSKKHSAALERISEDLKMDRELSTKRFATLEQLTQKALAIQDTIDTLSFVERFNELTPDRDATVESAVESARCKLALQITEGQQILKDFFVIQEEGFSRLSKAQGTARQSSSKRLNTLAVGQSAALTLQVKNKKALKQLLTDGTNDDTRTLGEISAIRRALDGLNKRDERLRENQRLYTEKLKLASVAQAAIAEGNLMRGHIDRLLENERDLRRDLGAAIKAIGTATEQLQIPESDKAKLRKYLTQMKA